MKLVQVAEQNKRYYTKEFIHGFNTGAKTQYEADSKERRERWVMDGCIEKCSLCGEPRLFPHWIACPGCGARMEAE